MFWRKQQRDLRSMLQRHRSVKVDGMRFVIRKINPLLDFPSDKIPQIFTDFKSQRPATDAKSIPPEQLKRALADIVNIIEAGVVEPRLAPVGSKKPEHEGMITAEDIMHDFDMGYKLYIEILAHSLNRFRGLKSLFFSMKIRGTLYSEWRRNIKSSRLDFSSLMATIR